MNSIRNTVLYLPPHIPSLYLHLTHLTHPSTSISPPPLPPQRCKCTRTWYQIRRARDNRPNFSKLELEQLLTVLPYYITHVIQSKFS